MQLILTFAIRAYQRVLSPALAALLGPLAGCRYEPTCSQYALEALRVHGVFRGAWMTLKRICRCQPWGGCGYDPVPPVTGKSVEICHRGCHASRHSQGRPAAELL